MTKTAKHDWNNGLKLYERSFVENACLMHGCSLSQAKTGSAALNSMQQMGLMPEDVFNEEDGFDAGKAVLKMIDNGVLKTRKSERPVANTQENAPSTEESQSYKETIRPAIRGSGTALKLDTTLASGAKLMDGPENQDPGSHLEKEVAMTSEVPGPITSDQDRRPTGTASGRGTTPIESSPTAIGTTTGKGENGDTLIRDQLKELGLAQSG